MANPIQEYQTARRMPIPALVAVLNGQSDMVSLGVAHAALKEKMEAEVAKKGANAMQMAQAPKVVQKDMQMAQGLASTPADVNVPMGGIVGNEGQMTQSAAGGGSVVAFQAGGPALADVLNQMSLQERMDYQRSGRLPERFRQMLAGEMAMPQAALRGPGRGTTFTEALQAQGMGATPLSTDTMAFFPGMGPLLQRQNAAKTAQTQQDEYYARTKRDPLVDYSKADVNLATGVAQDTGGVPTQSLADFEAAQNKKREEAGAGGAPTGIAAIAASQAQVKDPASFEEVTNQAKELAKKYEVASKDKKEFKDFTQEYVDTLKAAGYDFDLVKDNITKLAEEKEALKGEKKEAANLRLIEAGLGILGGESPYAFVNIGKGATPALQGLAKDLKEIKKTSRALDKETLQLQLMQNQMAEGKVKYAQGRLDKQEERADRLAEKKMDIEVRIADRIASNDIQRFVTETSRKTQLEVQSMQQSTARMQLEAQNIDREGARDDRLIKAAQEQAAKDVRDNPMSINMTAAQKEAEISRLARMYYANMTALRKGEGAAQTSTDPVAAARAEMERRGLR